MGIPRLDLCVKPVETFNCKTCQAAWREEEEQELHCFKHCVVNWLIEHLCNSEISFLNTHHPACHRLLSPLTHFPFSDGFQHEMRAGVKFCWKSKEKLSWQTPSLLLRPEISRCWGKGRLVLKFPLITFSWGGQDGTRWLHCLVRTYNGPAWHPLQLHRPALTVPCLPSPPSQLGWQTVC